MSEVMTLKSGYANEKGDSDYFRAMTIEEAKLLHAGERIPFRDIRNQSRMLTVNGAPKTWKRDSNRVEIPGKYGMYEYATFANRPDGTLQTSSGAMLLVRV